MCMGSCASTQCKTIAKCEEKRHFKNLEIVNIRLYYKVTNKKSKIGNLHLLSLFLTSILGFSRCRSSSGFAFVLYFLKLPFCRGFNTIFRVDFPV